MQWYDYRMFEGKHVQRTGAPSEATLKDPGFVRNSMQSTLMTAWKASGGNIAEWLERYAQRFSDLVEKDPETYRAFVEGEISTSDMQERLETLH